MAQEWNDFVLGHDQGTIFHLTAWKDVVEDTFGHTCHYAAVRSQGKMTGIFPVFEIRSRLFGHFHVAIPFAEIGGFLSVNPETDSFLMSHARNLLENSGAGYIEFKNPEAVPGLVTKDLYYNFSKPISADHDKNLLAIPRKSRAMVRKALKNGLRSETGDHLVAEFYRLLSMNFHRLGTPVFSRQLFANFLKRFNQDCNIMIIRNRENQAIAGVLYFMFKNRMIPYYAGSDFRYRQLGPNDFMYWRLMCLAADLGLKIFDFGRSKIGTGSFDFKRHWGFEPVSLAYQYMLTKGQGLPNLSPANPEYQRKIMLWKKLPIGLTRIMGPYISKYLA